MKQKTGWNPYKKKYTARKQKGEINAQMQVGPMPYLYGAGIGVLFFLAVIYLAPSFTAAAGSMMPFVFLALFVAANVFLTIKMKIPSFVGVRLYLVSTVSMFAAYKLATIPGVIHAYRADGFLADYEVSQYQMMDGLFLFSMFALFLTSVLVRFAFTKKKLTQISRPTLKRFFWSMLIIAIITAVSMASWQITKPYTAKFDEYCKTFTTEKWRDYPQKRHLMLDDFNASNHLEEMTRDEVRALLGTGEESDDSQDSYLIAYSFDGDHMIIVRYSENGAVESVEETVKPVDLNQMMPMQ